MALIKCKDCGKDVSTLAISCPNCGRPVGQHHPPSPKEPPTTCSKGITHTLDEFEKYGTREKSTGRGDGYKKNSVTQELYLKTPKAAKPEKPGFTKSPIIALIIIIGFCFTALFYATRLKSEKPDNSAVFPPVEQSAQFTTEQGIHKKCLDNIEGYKAEFTRLMSDKNYWDAGFKTGLIEECAKTLQDKSLEAWADDARIQTCMQSINDPTTPIPEKINTIEMLEQFYPGKVQPCVSRLAELRREWDSPPEPKSGTSGRTPEKIDVGTLIDRVIAGDKFEGHELIVTGVALTKGKNDGGLLNLATQTTYNSDSYLNYISVYGTNVSIKKGAVVQVKIRVVSSEAHNTNGVDTVLIHTNFQECISCRSGTQ